MLLNEPSHHPTRPAAATAAAAASTRELLPVKVDGAPAPPPATGAEADTVAFTAVDRGAGESTSGANGSSGANSGSGSGDGVNAAADGGSSANDVEADAEAPTVGIEAIGSSSNADSTVALDVEAVKRAIAESTSLQDATATVSLNVEAVKEAAAQAPTVAFGPVDATSAAEETGSTTADATDTSTDSIAGSSESDTDSDSKPSDPESTIGATDGVDPSADDPSADHIDSAIPGTDSSTDLVPSTGDVDTTATATYLVSTNLSTPTSTVVAMPETADDVIATIHAAATAVAAADRRARQAAAKADPWTGLDLHQPAVPAPVDNVLDLLSPVLERPLLVVEQPGLPQAADVVALHRSELEVDFVEPPVVAAGAEPPIPPRYGPGLSVLPHIEFPV